MLFDVPYKESLTKVYILQTKTLLRVKGCTSSLEPHV